MYHLFAALFFALPVFALVLPLQRFFPVVVVLFGLLGVVLVARRGQEG